MATVVVIDNNINKNDGVVDFEDNDSAPCCPGVVNPGTKPASLL